MNNKLVKLNFTIVKYIINFIFNIVLNNIYRAITINVNNFVILYTSVYIICIGCVITFN